jgi:hypothetical protein
MKLRVIISLALLALLTTYIAAFSCWWRQGPRSTRYVGGIHVEYLEFHYNRLSWHTRILWTPALWVAQHCGGYDRFSFAAAGKDSVILYARPDDEIWVQRTGTGR